MTTDEISHTFLDISENESRKILTAMSLSIVLGIPATATWRPRSATSFRRSGPIYFNPKNGKTNELLRNNGEIIRRVNHLINQSCSSLSTITTYDIHLDHRKTLIVLLHSLYCLFLLLFFSFFALASLWIRHLVFSLFPVTVERREKIYVPDLFHDPGYYQQSYLYHGLLVKYEEKYHRVCGYCWQL